MHDRTETEITSQLTELERAINNRNVDLLLSKTPTCTVASMKAFQIIQMNYMSRQPWGDIYRNQGVQYILSFYNNTEIS